MKECPYCLYPSVKQKYGWYQCLNEIENHGWDPKNWVVMEHE